MCQRKMDAISERRERKLVVLMCVEGKQATFSRTVSSRILTQRPWGKGKNATRQRL